VNAPEEKVNVSDHRMPGQPLDKVFPVTALQPKAISLVVCPFKDILNTMGKVAILLAECVNAVALRLAPLKEYQRRPPFHGHAGIEAKRRTDTEIFWLDEHGMDFPESTVQVVPHAAKSISRTTFEIERDLERVPDGFRAVFRCIFHEKIRQLIGPLVKEFPHTAGKCCPDLGSGMTGNDGKVILRPEAPRIFRFPDGRDRMSEDESRVSPEGIETFRVKQLIHDRRDACARFPVPLASEQAHGIISEFERGVYIHQSLIIHPLRDQRIIANPAKEVG
jgi:hypothetical protein